MAAKSRLRWAFRPASPLLATLLLLALYVLGQAREDINWLIWVGMDDTEGRAGLHTGQHVPPDSHNVAVIDGVEYQYEHIGNMGYAPVPLGTPILFRSWSPITPCFSGYTTVGQWYPMFVTPVEASRVPYGLRSQYDTECDRTPPGTPRVSMSVEFFVADRPEPPTMSLDWQFIGGVRTRDITIHAEYLEGNALHARGTDEAVLHGVGGSRTLGLMWGDFQFIPGEPLAYLSEQAPIGPMRLSVGIDGYTTDTLLLDVEDCTYYRWTALTAPVRDDSATPGASRILNGWELIPLPVPGVVLRGAQEWRILGVCSQSSNIEPFIDANQDTVTDCADLVAGSERYANE